MTGAAGGPSSRPASRPAGRDRLRLAFEEKAADYARVRPDYPEAALDWALPADARQVLDLGAGTGKLTAQLVARGLEVTAVEPGDRMRAQLEALVPRARAVAGTSEAIPVPDASQDAVTVAQAFHWFDQARSLPEIARVLRPGRPLVVLWNRLAPRTAWTRELLRVLPEGYSQSEGLAPFEHPDFGPVEVRAFEHSYALAAEALPELVATHSVVIRMPEARRAALLSAVARLAAGLPDERVALPIDTTVWRAETLATGH